MIYRFDGEYMLNEEELVSSLIEVLRDINDSLEKVAQAMEVSNEPTIKIDEFGDRI
tara:strand:+ start:490 stop:657 length:168 start_codon:yes stop_codon:yes gene_type:complete